MYSLGRRLKVPKRFSELKPKAISKARPKAFGLATDVAKGLPLENSKRGLQHSSKGVQYSRDIQRAPFTMIPPRLSHRISFFLPNAPVY